MQVAKMLIIIAALFAAAAAHGVHDGTHLSFHPSCALESTLCATTADCCSPNICTPAPWAPEIPRQCRRPQPKCYATGDRCAGEPGHEYVPYAPCCGGEACRRDGARWGRFCLEGEGGREKVGDMMHAHGDGMHAHGDEIHGRGDAMYDEGMSHGHGE